MTPEKPLQDVCNTLACEIIKRLHRLPELLLLDESADKLAKARRLAVELGGALEEFVVGLDKLVVIWRDKE